MKTLFKVAALLGVAGAAALIIAATRLSPESAIFEQFTVTAHDRLVIAVDYGDIEIFGQDTDKVNLSVEPKVADDTHVLRVDGLTCTQTNGTVTIVARHGNETDPQPRYRLLIPKALQLTLSTGHGKISAYQVVGRVDAETHGEDLEISFGGTPQEDCCLLTHGGDLTLTMPEQVSFNVDLLSGGAPIISDVPVVRQSQLQHRGLTGKAGEGGQCIKAVSAGGKITLQRDRVSS